MRGSKRVRVRERKTLEDAKMLALKWGLAWGVGGWCYELRNAGGLQKLEQAIKWIPPESSEKGCRPAASI